jgi:hypothetical protein
MIPLVPSPKRIIRTRGPILQSVGVANATGEWPSHKRTKPVVALDSRPTATFLAILLYPSQFCAASHPTPPY